METSCMLADVKVYEVWGFGALEVIRRCSDVGV